MKWKKKLRLNKKIFKIIILVNYQAEVNYLSLAQLLDRKTPISLILLFNKNIIKVWI